MDNEELKEWSFNELEALRKQGLEIRKLENLIASYKDSIYGLSGAAMYERVQETKRIDAMETKIVEMVTLQDELIAIAIDYVPRDRDICTRLNRLPCVLSCTLTYRYSLGMSFDAIAERLEVCPVTVRRWHNKALAMYGQMFYQGDNKSPNMDRLEGLQDGL